MSEWQPIDTAPKDGTHFLVWEPDAAPNIAVAYYVSLEGMTFFAYADDVLSDAMPDGPEATHWQPLLQPPTS